MWRVQEVHGDRIKHDFQHTLTHTHFITSLTKTISWHMSHFVLYTGGILRWGGCIIIKITWHPNWLVKLFEISSNHVLSRFETTNWGKVKFCVFWHSDVRNLSSQIIHDKNGIVANRRRTNPIGYILQDNRDK